MKHSYVILMAVALFSRNVDAAVVTDTNISLSNGGTFSDYALTVFQDKAATDPTTMWFNASGPTLSYVTMNLDEGSDWYLTSFGDQFARASIQNSEFPVLVRVTPGGEANPLTVGFGDFYLGVNTGNREGTWGGPGIPPRNLYGWVHLQNAGGTITMLGNAMAYQGDGIVIGTTDVIPEPSVSWLLALSLGAVIAFAAWFRKRTEQNHCSECRAGTLIPNWNSLVRHR